MFYQLQNKYSNISIIKSGGMLEKLKYLFCFYFFLRKKRKET